MKFTVLNWNIGGAKFLEEKNRDKRKVVRDKINKALVSMLTDREIGPEPDVVTLQEIVQYKEPNDGHIHDILNIEVIQDLGYGYFPFILINSNILSSRAKWNKVLGINEIPDNKSDWDVNTFFAQGNAFLIKKDVPHFPIWDLSDLDQERPGNYDDHFIEQVHLDSGLYFGDRNTEPRAAIVAHFIYNPKDDLETEQHADRKPLDIFVINLHLTTLMMEREGIPEIDSRAVKIRQNQMDIVFDGIISRYNLWRQGGYLERNKPRNFKSIETDKRHSPVWIISGDFNFTEESAEYAFVNRMNFIDTIPSEGKESEWARNIRAKGSKAKGTNQPPTLNLDYIFAGPKYVALDDAITLYRNRVIHDRIVRASDHYPLITSMEIVPS